ncbi:FHA domain-containing protein [Frateuria terrea]|uniref:FHA domain-containing protein n=1 Tax=Frateuria terrea TaxID=529704 RepID=A0A1H6YZ16_9GAMM|nr:FHA domain-containing protein [Frateuria terrea]SEJ42622.1 FHA domain-containing protein [Frateuria terrea]SFP73137.1 FHA domain-containing protein [Frateuria terrea]
MDSPGETTVLPRSKRSAGPQGTRLFSAEELRQFAREAAPVLLGRASAAAPVLEGANGVVLGRRLSLRAGRQTIGRRSDNDIVLDDLSVSASHAWIMNQQGQYVLMNTLSTNGTFVNGKRIHEATLRHGDRVRFGQVEFTFLTRERGAGGVAWRNWLALGAVALVAMGVAAWWLA